MKAIEQIIEYLDRNGGLSSGQMAFLREEGWVEDPIKELEDILSRLGEMADQLDSGMWFFPPEATPLISQARELKARHKTPEAYLEDRYHRLLEHEELIRESEPFNDELYNAVQRDIFVTGVALSNYQ